MILIHISKQSFTYFTDETSEISENDTVPI